jgi:predicted MFS family arabinose efflux permease
MNPFTRPLNRWYTVLAGALGCAAGSGVVSSYVFGMFIKAISAEYHWDRSVVTAAILCFYIFCGIGCLSLGQVMSRWGVRPAAIVYVTFFAIATAAVGLLPRSVFLFCLTFGAMGFFGAAASAVPYGVAIAGWFGRQRGLALAIAVSGTGASAVFMPAYADWLMRHYGWRGGYAGVGAFCAVVALIGLIFFFRMPARAADSAAGSTGRWRNLFTPAYLRITVPVFMISIAMMGCITNLPPIFTDRGMSLGETAALLSILGGASWVSRLGVGLLLDRLHARWVAAAIFLLVALGQAIVLSGVGGIAPMIAMVVIGLGIGSEADLIAYAVSRYFDRAHLPKALGATWVFWAWGGGIGVMLGSLSFDVTGSYAAAICFYAMLSLASAAVIATLGRYTEQSLGH